MDLYLIHSPSFVKDLKKTWSQLEDAKAKGLTKSIGVSNFTVNDLRKLEGSKVTPAANQVSYPSKHFVYKLEISNRLGSTRTISQSKLLFWRTPRNTGLLLRPTALCLL